MFDWQRNTQIDSNLASGEFESSNLLSGKHGEYDLSKGHFFCMDPYPDASNGP